MKKTHRILSLVFAMVILATSVCSASANGIPSVIDDYFTCLDEQNWSALGALLADEDQAEFEAFIANSDNRDGHIGYFNFESVSIVACQSVAADEINTSNVDAEKLSKYTNVECWDCIVDVEAYADSDYLKTGYNHYIIYTASDTNGDSRILQIVRDKAYSYSEDSVSLCGDIDDPVSSTYGSEWENPATIKVKYDDVILTLDFKEYCYVVLMNEFGTDSFNEEARKASAMCVKQYAWNRTLVQKYPNLGYDLNSDTDDQVYNPNKTPTTRVIAAMDAIWDYMMLTEDHRLFCSYYRSSSSKDLEDLKGAGFLFHNEANELGNNGYVWQQILNFFYDDSEPYGKALGNVSIIHFNHAVVGIVRRVPGNVHSHNVICDTCGSTHAQAHTWTASGSSYVCTKCNYVTDLAPSAPLKCEE